MMTNMEEAIVTFVLISYNEVNDYYVSIGSLLCQKNPHWKAIVYHDGPNNYARAIVEGFNDPRIRYIEAPTNRGAWGCYNRIDALNNMVDTEYAIQGTVQEYFAPVLVNLIYDNREVDIILWDTVHHHFGYCVLNVEPRINKVDWCNFAIKTSIAKAVGIKDPTSFRADGEFVQDCMASGLVKTATKIPRVFTIKN